MERITAITAQKNNPKRANIFIDGEYRCWLDKIVVVGFGLKEGDEIDAEKLSQMIADSQEKSAFDLSIKYLTIRMRSQQEIKNYLASKKFSPSAIESTLKKLREYKYVDDQQFCKAYIKTYGHKYGHKKIAFELSRLGVDERIIDAQLDEEGVNQKDAADLAAEKYVRTHRKLSYNKIASFLYGRGFDNETCRSVAAKFASKINENTQEITD